MAKKLLGVKADLEIIEEIDAISRETGQTRSQVTLQLLRRSLGLEETDTTKKYLG